MDKLDFIEKLARANLEQRMKNADDIAHEAHQTLVLLLAGAGAAIAYAVTGLEEDVLTATSVSSGLFAVYLSILSVLIVRWCLMLEEFPALGNEPNNILSVDRDLEALRMLELKSEQNRIEQATRIIARRAGSLNRIRNLAALGPIVWLVAFSFWELLSG